MPGADLNAKRDDVPQMLISRDLAVCDLEDTGLGEGERSAD